RLFDLQGRGGRPDALARSRPWRIQHPRQCRHPWLDHDPAPARSVADAGGRKRPDAAAMHQAQALSRRCRAAGAVSLFGLRICVHQPELRGRWRTMVTDTSVLKVEPHDDVLIVVPKAFAEDVDTAGMLGALIDAEAHPDRVVFG